MATLTTDRYARTSAGIQWSVPGTFETTFRWEYEDGRDSLLKLYEKGKQRQWDADTRIDWSQDLDPENPEQLPDESIPIFGSDVCERLTEPEKADVRRHFQAWQLSQFLHGEQGALICTAKIVQQVPSIDAKFYAATQVIDEARHVEAYSRLLHEKFELAYPITPTLQAPARRRAERLALGHDVPRHAGAHRGPRARRLRARSAISRRTRSRRAVNAYVMQDEARHVAFGRLALRDYYPQLTAGRARRARGVRRRGLLPDARPLPRPRRCGRRSACPSTSAPRYMLELGASCSSYRSALFSRIVPTIKDIGLWGPKIRKGYEKMGILGFADIDVAAMSVKDEEVAAEFDARRAEIDRVAQAR